MTAAATSKDERPQALDGTELREEGFSVGVEKVGGGSESSVRVWCTGLLVVGAAHGPALLLLSKPVLAAACKLAHTTKLLMTKKYHHASVTNSCFLHIARSGLPTRAAPIVTAGRVNPRSHVS